MLTHLTLLRTHQRLRSVLFPPQCGRWRRSASGSYAQARCVSVLPTAPAPPAAPSPLPTSSTLTSNESTALAGSVNFADALQRAVEDTIASVAGGEAHEHHRAAATSSSSAASAPSHLSPWLQYLVGLRDDSPGETRSDTAHSRHLSALSTSATSGAGSVFLNHVFDNAKEASLYVSVRQPREFLCPEPTPLPHLGKDDSNTPAWSLIPFSTVFSRLERTLHTMAKREWAKQWKKTSLESAQDAATRERFLLAFWRSMLEQAFLVQYCEVHSLSFTPTTVGGSNTACDEIAVHDAYLYDYREQPEELRRHLEVAIRALLCASAFTLHAQWEQYMVRRGPADVLGHVLGLEFVLLWWYANPDQMPVELTAQVQRFPPSTLRQQQQQQVNCTEVGNNTPSYRGQRGAPAGSAPATGTVEDHLRDYLQAHVTAGATSSSKGEVDTAAAIGLLCPEAMFPGSYRDALRAHLRQVRHRKDTITSPLFARVIEVALMVGSADLQSWSDAAPAQSTWSAASINSRGNIAPQQCTPGQMAGKRGREIAQFLVVDWLWPVVCDTPLTSVPHAPPPTVHELLHPAASNIASFSPRVGTAAEGAAEPLESWAVLVAAVTAVAQVRGHMLSLRRSAGAPRRAKAESTTGSVKEPKGEMAESLADIRDRLYAPAMRTLLTTTSMHGTSTRTVEGDPPSWIYLVFTQVAFCFQECGWLNRNIAQQPATPARLWGRLFHALCTAFPNVFHAGSTVTVLLALWAMEGAAAVPSTYYSTLHPLSKGKAEALQAWTDVVALAQTTRLCTFRDTPHNRQLPSAEGEAAIAAQRLLFGGVSLCPQAERCRRAMHVAAAVSGESQQTLSDSVPQLYTFSEDAGARTDASRSTRRGARRGDAALLLHSSFATPCPPTPPTHLCTEEARAQMQTYLTATRELREEVVCVLVGIFRHYATLPVLRSSSPVSMADGSQSRLGTGSTSLDGPSTNEVALLRRTGQPSLLVLLKLLHSIAVFGDAFASTRTGAAGGSNAKVAGLVPSVLHDVASVCHPVIAAYLRKMQVYSATMSGREGALALLFDDDLQTQLNGLPPQVGRRRLTVALLWSGLPASTLTRLNSEDKTEVQADRAAFGSGSLAWHVLGSNQLHFFSTKTPPVSLLPTDESSAPTTHEGTASSEAASEAAAPVTSNTLADVSGLLEEVLRHLWQLAIAVAEPARVVLDLGLHRGSFRSKCDKKANLTDLHIEATTASPTNAEDRESYGSDVDDDADPADVYPIHVSAEADSEATATPWGALAETEESDFSAPSDWSDEATGAVTDPTASAHSFIEAGGHASTPSQWDSRSAFTTPSAAAPQPTPLSSSADEVMSEAEAASGEDAEADSASHARRRALVAALQPALPAAQHLFFSLLEVLAWVGNAQQAEEALTSLTMADNDQTLSALENVGSATWCTQLATYYSLCVAVWAAPLDLSLESNGEVPPLTSASARHKKPVLCRPKLMEQTFLLLTQTCPDVYLLSLLLLHLVVRGIEGPFTSSAARAILSLRCQRSGSVLPWSVECALAQIFYHAGVTSATVLRWRTTQANGSRSTGREVSEGVDELLAQVQVHHALLRSIATPSKEGSRANTCSDTPSRKVGDSALNTSRLDELTVWEGTATQRDLVMSIGSILLFSLRHRLRSATGHRTFYRYNFYVDEFLLNTFATASETNKADITALRVVLPSVQLTSPSPSSAPPQQLISLRQTWRGGVTPKQREGIRSCFRGHRSSNCSPVDSSEISTPVDADGLKTARHGTAAESKEEDEQQYLNAFL